MERLTIKAPSGLIHLGDNEADTINRAIKKLSDYEDLEEQEKLLSLPCKVGDIVFYKDEYSTWRTGIESYQITNIMISQNKKGEWTKKYRAMMLLNGKIIDVQLNFSFNDLCKTVFLTKEEAESALEKMKGE